MQLYTSLVRLKQALNGGALPPMTPIGVSAAKVIDPELTIGLGALAEDAERGLRCPVRGCGEYFHAIKRHWDITHRDMGGSKQIRALLSIPRSASLVSQAHLDKQRTLNAARPDNGASGFRAWRASNPGKHTSSGGSVRRQQSTIRASRTSTGYRNLRQRCRAQLSHALIDLETRFGRPPSSRDAVAVMGRGFYRAVLDVFGSWDNAMGQCGLRRYVTRKRAPDREGVARDIALASLKAWHEVHGALPSQADAACRDRAPLLVGAPQILNGLKQRDWGEAMRVAASLLDIRGGRYGLPERVFVAAD